MKRNALFVNSTCYSEDELIRYLQSGQRVDPMLLKERRNGFAMLLHDGAVSVLTGDAVQRWLNRRNTESDRPVREVRGLTALHPSMPDGQFVFPGGKLPAGLIASIFQILIKSMYCNWYQFCKYILGGMDRGAKKRNIENKNTMRCASDNLKQKGVRHGKDQGYGFGRCS